MPRLRDVRLPRVDLAPVKILVVAQDFPWPPTYGSRLRLVQVLEVAASLGETDLFSFVLGGWDDPIALPPDLDIRRFETVRGIHRMYKPARRLEFLGSPGIPLEAVASKSPEARERFREWVDESYDVVWFSKAMTYHLLGRPQLGPTIVDLDDLEDRKIAARLEAMRKEGKRDGALHYFGAVAQAQLNAHRWKTFQSTTAKSVDRVVLCSELDVARFGGGNAVIVPNGFDLPEKPAGRVEVGEPPTILLQGSLRYGPNSDAATWLVTMIVPYIREKFPDVRVRLVGDPDGSVAELHDPPAVTVAGRVPSMEPELSRADLVAVPLRYGSGTRVKILEAFANKIPVVSTTIGAEGLHVEPGRELLVADDPQSFAEACVRLLQDTQLRASLAESAHQVFLDRHQWAVARTRIRDLFLETAGVESVAPRPVRVQDKSVQENRVGFLVVGSARSGTTLVQRLACEIKGVRMPPETHFFSDFAWDLCFRRIFPIAMPELRDEIERFLALENSKGLEIDIPALVEDLRGKCNSIFELFEAIVRNLTGGARVLGEKTPGHLWWWPAIAEAAPHVQFVLTVRDPRAVVASILSMPWAKEGELAQWGDKAHLSLATRWAFDQEVAAAMIDAVGPSRCVVLRYEDVVARPETARHGIARLIGLGEDVSYQKAPDDLVLPWESWKLRALDEVTTDRVSTWGEDLGTARADEVAAICRAGMVRFGYSLRQPDAKTAALRRFRLGKKVREKLDEELDHYRIYESKIKQINL
jgi:glycosyltransferase involved in cell wall biosynthesis